MPTGATRVVAFGSLFDLARLKIGAAQAEICDACNTINKGSARYCKGCTHKLPAFYAAAHDDQHDSVRSDGDHDAPVASEAAMRRSAARTPGRALATPLAAFSMAINLLVVITAPFMPMR